MSGAGGEALAYLLIILFAGLLGLFWDAFVQYIRHRNERIRNERLSH